MGLTPDFDLPFPEDGDPADVPADVRALAERLEEVLTDLQVAVHQPGDLKACGYPVSAGSEPAGWLLCDGREVSRSTYDDLFAAIGVAYGVGNNATTFNLPDLRGRVVSGRDAAQTEFNALGKTGGAKTHAITMAEMPYHSHRADNGAGGGGATTGGTTGDTAPAGTTDETGSHVHSMPQNFALTNGLTAGLGSGGTQRFLTTSHQALTYANGHHGHTVQVNAHGHSVPQLGIYPNGGSAETSLLQPYTTANYLVKT